MRSVVSQQMVLSCGTDPSVPYKNRKRSGFGNDILYIFPSVCDNKRELSIFSEDTTMKVMVFDVGGTEIKYSVMDEQLNRTDAGSVPTPQDTQEHFLDAVYTLYAPHRDEVDGIAMALPGFVNSKTGFVSNGGALLYNSGTPVGQRLAEKCGCRVLLENDGKAAAMAELQSGVLQGCCNAAVFLIGTGVGGGIIANGQLVRGTHFTAGEYSFVNTNADAWADESKNMACQCSTRALLEWYRARKGLPEDAPLDGRQFFDAVHAGEPEAQEVLDRFCHAVAVQIFNLTVLLDVEKVAIGGGISRQPILLERLRSAYEALYTARPFSAYMVGLPRTEIVACHYGSEANQVGALSAYQLAFHC